MDTIPDTHGARIPGGSSSALKAGDDIEVFVLTRNRVEFLKQAVQSLLDQTLRDARVTVVDNASDDGTEGDLSAMAAENPRLCYVRQPQNVGPTGNFETAVRLARARYAMIFHDDDILHPLYLEMALKAIRRHPKVTMLVGNSIVPPVVNAEHWEPVSQSYSLCETPVDFAAFLYVVGRIAFPTAVYHVESLRRVRARNDLYGKIADKPLLQEAAGQGMAVVFHDKRLLRYRVHPGQDTNARSTGPFYAEMINHNRFFKDILWKTRRTRWIFNMRCQKHLKSLYKMGGDRTLSFRQFVKKANDEGAGCLASRLCNLPVIGPVFYPLCNMMRGVIERGFPHGDLEK